METISTAEHLEHIRGILLKVSGREVDVELCADVADWWRERGQEIDCNPVAQALKAKGTANWRILIRSRIDEEAIRDVVGGLLFRGFAGAEQSLSTPERFVAHLALHELAHLQNGWGNERERECDEWAFKMLAVAL